MILVFGSINVDLVARVADIPRPGETVLAASSARYFGGKGANQAVAAAVAVAGALPVVMAGAMGQDSFGQDCTANFARRGVETWALQQDHAPTGLAFIVVDHAGENAITVASGANLGLRAEAIPTRALEGLRLCVLQMEVRLHETLRAADMARQAGAKVMLNLAPAPTQLSQADLVALLEAIDILVVNEHEAAAIRALAPAGARDLEQIAARFALDLVMTLGAEGLCHIAPDGARIRLAARRVEVRDTTGAGDTFVGALAGALALGRPMPEALGLAAEAATLACTWEGAQPPLPGQSALTA